MSSEVTLSISARFSLSEFILPNARRLFPIERHLASPLSEATESCAMSCFLAALSLASDNGFSLRVLMILLILMMVIVVAIVLLQTQMRKKELLRTELKEVSKIYLINVIENQKIKYLELF